MLTKYEASYKIRISINDPDCFISRHLERYHVFKLSLYTLENTDLFAIAPALYEQARLYARI